MLKKDLRVLFKNKREALTPTEITQYSIAVQQQLFILLDQLEFSNINCFLSSSVKKEIQTDGIIQELLNSNKKLTVPVSNYTDFSITPSLFTNESGLKLDQFHIPTPIDLAPVSAAEIDVIICPLLCFDERGYRTGYGKGMYDRFIAQCRENVITIGLSLFDPVEQIQDIDDFDRRLDYVVGVEKIWEF